MEEKENAVTQTEQKTEVKETKANEEAKTFTQEQVNAMLAKERKGLPSKEELDSFNKWKESQKTEEEKKREEDDKTQKEIQEGKAAKMELLVLKAGVPSKFSGYVSYEVAKMDGDFKENLEKFLKENPEFSKTTEVKVVKKTSSSASMSGKTQAGENETNQIMNDIIRNSRK